MWALPDIQRLNEDAEEFKSTLERIVLNNELPNGEPLKCNHDGDECDGEVRAIPYFDIFSDTPKGHIDLCERHYGYYGWPDEGYFECEGCNRVMVENYTWELYYHQDGCGIYCLNCWRESVLQDEDEWVVLTPENLVDLNFDQVRRAKHLTAVGQDCPKELELVGNVEMDGSTGGKLRTTSYADTDPADAVEEIRSLLLEAMERGRKRAILILDGAYQFSVSIGIYTDADGFAGAREWLVLIPAQRGIRFTPVSRMLMRQGQSQALVQIEPHGGNRDGKRTTC
jgi:hypothetical protein